MQIYLNSREHIFWSSGKILNIVYKSISGQKHLYECVHFYLGRKYALKCNLSHSLYKPFPPSIYFIKETHDNYWIWNIIFSVIRSGISNTSWNRMILQATQSLLPSAPLYNTFFLFFLYPSIHIQVLEPKLTEAVWEYV